MNKPSEAILDQARDRMTGLARNLASVMPPIDAAGVLVGAAIGLLVSTHGPAKAREYFAELADEIEQADEPGMRGHA